MLSCDDVAVLVGNNQNISITKSLYINIRFGGVDGDE